MARRLLMIAGSGETSPRMAPVHRAVVRRLEAGLGRPAVGAILDTPYGFQENADHITERTVRYFRDRVGIHVEPVRLRRSGVAADDAAATEAVRRADFVFAGPGSPSYALQHWRASGVAWALREKAELGGALSFASAAAITLGAFAMPVYEIYKAGHDIHWLPGLDILSAAGLRVALVPHFDNSEGGAHDSRYCFVGERRFAELEAQLAQDAWVLGVDENTALTLDVDDGTAEVRGPGTVTLRVDGTSMQFHAGAPFPTQELRAPAQRLTSAAGPGHAAAPAHESGASAVLEAAVSTALGADDVDGAVKAILELESKAIGPSHPSVDGARHALRSAILSVGELAANGRTERLHEDVLVRALLDLRSRARDAGDWTTADEIRDALAEAGVRVRDTAAGASWERIGPIDRPD
jgi:cyanophycinase-like exopeptidase